MKLRMTMINIGLTTSLLLAGTSLALADQVTLNNGDRLTGKLIEASAETLTFRLESSDSKVSIPWSQVSGVQTDDNVRVILVDGTEVVGRAELVEPGKIRLVSADLDEPANFNISAIEIINEPGAPSQDGVRTSGNIAVGGSLTRGNTRTEATTVVANFEARTRLNRFRADSAFNRAKENDELSRDNAQGTARYDHFLSERVYVNSNISLLRDRFKDLRLRTAVGVGLGYQFLDTSRRSLSAELGGSLVNQDFYEAENESNPAARWALDYQQRLFGGGISLFHNSEGLHSLDDVDEFLILARTGMRFPLIAGLTGTVQVNVDYDNNPPEDSRRVDTAYLITVGYSW